MIHAQGLRRTLNLWFPVTAWMAVIFHFSSQERPSISFLLPALTGLATSMNPQKIELILFKGGHFLGYLVLGMLLYRAFAAIGLEMAGYPKGPTLASSAGFRPFEAAIRALGVAVLYAFLDEWHQSFVPGRSPSLQDVAIDAAGAALGVAGWALASWLRTRTDRREDVDDGAAPNHSGVPSGRLDAEAERGWGGHRQ